jgi:hypothetical protein
MQHYDQIRIGPSICPSKPDITPDQEMESSDE